MSFNPRAVLGIDAAWTDKQPSCVAAAFEEKEGWKLAAVEASYEDFIARAKGRPPSGERPRGSIPDARALLEAAGMICGRPVDLVAIDMPLARHKITMRRTSDIGVSKCYGAKGAATHSPSAARPGKISDALRAEFETRGFKLCTAAPAKGLIEVYPHPALIEFLKAAFRLRYKVAKSRQYWPGLPLAERRRKLCEVWEQIVEALEQRIEGVRAALREPSADDGGWRLKAYEDKLDAVVCAAVAISCLNGEAKAFGDADSAIWVPIAEA